MKPKVLTYAHIPGGGPAGKTCRRCAGLIEPQNKCRPAAEMAGVPLTRLGICSPSTSACKYFVERIAINTLDAGGFR